MVCPHIHHEWGVEAHLHLRRITYHVARDRLILCGFTAQEAGDAVRRGLAAYAIRSADSLTHCDITKWSR